ncbi:DNA-binding response regulator, OmpR family, contains REC and winged-helix (wHTH) domain [Paenibacillus uliginis N3/975]|uniref:DNA-binding response regulator, OmpR family, contains REC and winged-helix (WHTH) domain n=1 Tax=Paenibacillus uliginis N3/975 TaxID=1313296 RepID=A0A1X7HGD6_9BACL|nr:response regulator transcription factor [Paenibacillus uliginis]SMF85844.1 DNA-binding response regulator, OmpR family, contains REC and winged-helix (wHTH) domain [Paenibacillus uliginis N3/975]
MKLLIVEDDIGISHTIARVMQDEGHKVTECHNGEEGLHQALYGEFDLIILDIMLPKVDGFTFIQELRKQRVDTPILCLTAKDGLNDRVKGLTIGADDYVVKPFEIPELIVRAKVLLRRYGKVNQEEQISYGPIAIQVRNRAITVTGEELTLTEKEYELLEYLLMNKEQIVTKEQIYYRIWGLDSEAGIGIVELYVHYLRKKLSFWHADQYIQTVRGLGYILRINK